MADEKIRIVLADDHAVLRAGLRVLRNSQADLLVVGEAGDGDEVLQQIELHQPDILVLYWIMLRVAKGLDIIEELTAKNARLLKLVLTMHANTQYVRYVLKAGCAGYVTKSSADLQPSPPSARLPRASLVPEFPKQPTCSYRITDKRKKNLMSMTIGKN